MRRFLPGLLGMLFVFPLGSLEAETWQPGRPSNSFQFRLGGFFPEGGGDFWENNEQTFTLDHSDFNGTSLGLTYVASMNNHFEVGFNLDYYEQDVRSAYRGFVDQANFPILHDSRLRLIPATVDFRLLPAGRHAIRGRGDRRVLHPVPYLGGGVGFNFWEYEEVGDFLDFSVDPPVIFPDRFIESGTTFEAHALAGLELPVGPAWSVLLEGRYSWSDVTPNGDFAGLGNLDLDGLSAYVGFAFHF